MFHKHPKRKTMKKTITQKLMTVAMLSAFGFYQIGISQTNPTAQALPYSQNFGTGTFTVAPTGMAVWTINSSPASSQSNAESSTANGNATITAATATQTTGDAYGYATSSNGRLYFQTSSNTTNGTNQPVLAINTTGQTNISVTYGIEMIIGTPRTIGFVFQYRVGTSGTWTDVSGGVYSHTSSDRTNGQVDNFSLTLPSAANNQSVVQVRWACWRGTQSGNSSGAALDNISVTATSQVGGYFRSKQNGNWNSVSTWQASPDSATWVNATVVPSYHANSILVKDSVSITATDSIDQTTVSTSGILTYANVTGSTVNIMNGTGIDLNVLGKYYDAGSNNTVWATSATWQLGSSASLIRNRNTSSDVWRDHYYNTITNIPATSNWIAIKNSTDNPSLSSTNGMHYGNLSILNTTGSLWTTSGSSAFIGSTDFPIIKGSLSIGGSGGVSFLISNTNASPVLVNGNFTLASGSTLRNQGTGLELQGNVAMNGTLSTTGSAYILLSGSNTQTMSGSGLSFQYLTVNKTSVPATVTLNSPATITGTLTLTNGLIVSDTTHLLTFNAGTVVNGVNNDSSFVSGPVKKIGNTAFTFPLGKNTNAQIISITAPTSITDAFQAEYFDTNPTTIYGTYSDTTFNYISTCQFFKLLRKNGTSNIQPTLGYDASSCVAQLFPTPTIVGFNGTKWKELGFTNFTFTYSGGTASTSTTVTQYGAITFGTYNPLYASNHQGDSCYNSVTMPSGATSTITGFSQTKRATWFAFTPTTSEVKVTLTNTSMGSYHIRAIALMEGSCLQSNSAGLDSSATDTTLRIVLHEAQIGTPYFVVTVMDLQSCNSCTYTPTTFNLQVQSLTPPVQTVSSGVVSMNGVPSHMKQQIIIRVNKAHLNMSNVNNTSMLGGTVLQFIDTLTISKIALALYSGNTTIVKNLPMTKIFPSMTSADTISLSRDSSIVRVPDFFENFVLTVTEKDKIFYNSRLLCSILDGGEPNYVCISTSVPNDPNYAASQPNLHPITTYPNANINVENAWNIETGKSFVKVGIYDSGIDGTHDELTGKVAGGYNYAGNPGTAIPPNQNYDGFGHGTSCAGIIGAYRNNSIGIAGIAGGDASVGNPGCTFYDMRILDVSGNPVPVSTIANAIREGATSTGAGGYGLHIMNNSYGQASFGATTTLHDAIQFAVQNGVIFIASRGNWFDPSLNGTTCIVTLPNIDDAQYPSCYQDEMVINVGASGKDGQWKTIGNGDAANICDNNYQSMIKNSVDVIAPGTTVLVQTTNHTTNDYHSFSGTSASCPEVAGVAALMLSHVDQPNPAPNNLVIEDVETILQMSAADRSVSPASVGYDDYSGWGLLDATTAMNKINTPNFKIQHFGVGQNVTSSSTQTLVLNGGNYELIQLLSPYQGLPANTYRAYKVLVTITLNYNLSSPTDQIITSWPRYSSTVGWDITDAFNKNNWCQIISVSPTQAKLQTYVYDFFALSDGTSITDPWFPVHYSAAKVALSIYTQTGVTGIDKLNANDMVMGLYPNPADNSTTVNVTLSNPQKISLEVYDVQGRLVKNVANERISEGTHQYPILLGDMADGVYYVKLITETSTYGKKLIVTK
jgi:hypothetical protein